MLVDWIGTWLVCRYIDLNTFLWGKHLSDPQREIQLVSVVYGQILSPVPFG